MRTLGRSDNNGGYIVELSYAEFKTLAALSQAVNEMPINWFDNLSQPQQVELDKAFVAIFEYTTTLDLINQIQEKINQTRKLLQSDKTGDEPSYGELYDQARARLG